MDKEFYEICKNASPAGKYYVSLYAKSQYYGGHEEGGWWGTDIHLVASQEFSTLASAEVALEQIQTLAKQRTDDERDRYGKRCIEQLAWLDERGLDADYLPDEAPDTYFVVVEERVGSRESQGVRHYE